MCIHKCWRLLYTCTKVVHNTVAAATGLGRHNSRRRATQRKKHGDNNNKNTNKSAIINTAYLILMYYRVIFIVWTTVARRPGFFSYDTHFVSAKTKRILNKIGQHEKPELPDERRPGQIEGERRDGFVGEKKFRRFSAKKY